MTTFLNILAAVAIMMIVLTLVVFVTVVAYVVWRVFRKLQVIEANTLAFKNLVEDTNNRMRFLCEQLLLHIDEDRSRYVCAGGVFAWYVAYIVPGDRLTVITTVFVQDSPHFVPALVAGVLKRKHETQNLVILDWKPLTDAEFAKESDVRKELNDDPAMFN